MTDNDTVLELYNLGISAHKLRRSYVEDKLDDYPDAGDTRQELIAAAEEDEFFQAYLLPRTLDLLDRVESQIIDGLLSGDIVALGYDDPHDSVLKTMPSHQWHFLKLDFDKSVAIGTDLHYVGLRFLRNCDLTDQQLNVLQRQQPHRKTGQQAKKGDVVSLGLQANDWTDIKIRLLKDFQASVSVKGSGRRPHIANLGLISNATSKPNDPYNVLLDMARGLPVIPKVKKHSVTKLTKLLREYFGLSGKPFHIEKGRGYVPNFQLIDDRDALDRRAKEKAVQVPFNDDQQVDKQEPDDQDGYSYEEDWEMRGDEASAYIQKREKGG